MNLLRQLKALLRQRWPLAIAAVGLVLFFSTLWNGRSVTDETAPQAVSEQTLRLLTWEGYPTQTLVQSFVESTGIDVELGVLPDPQQLTTALRNPERAPYNLVTLPLEQVRELATNDPQLQPLDPERLESAAEPAIAAIAADYGSVDGESYAVPNVWGTTGLIVNRAALAGEVTSYQDLCAPAYRDRVSYRPAMSSLAAAAYGLGLEPFEFAAANPEDAAGWEAILSSAYDYLAACQDNVRDYWRDRQQQIQLMLDGEVDLAEGWDWTAWTLQRQNAEIDYVIPAEGLLGWLDVFAIPAGAEDLEAAYAWIDFVSQPEMAAIVLQETGTLPAVALAADDLEEQFQPLLADIYDDVDLSEIHWLPPGSPALEPVTEDYLEQLADLADV